MQALRPILNEGGEERRRKKRKERVAFGPWWRTVMNVELPSASASGDRKLKETPSPSRPFARTSPFSTYSLLRGHAVHAHLNLLVSAEHHTVSPELRNVPICCRAQALSNSSPGIVLDPRIPVALSPVSLCPLRSSGDSVARHHPSLLNSYTAVNVDETHT